MSNYRFAFLFCRVLVFYLGVTATISGISSIVSLLGYQFYRYGLGIVEPLAYGAGAVLFSVCSKGISAAMSGQSVLDGEAIHASNALTPQERTLVQSGAGMLLLVHAVIGVSSTVILRFFSFGSLASFSVMAYLVLPLLASAVKAAIGFFFAFRLNLRKLFPQ